MKRNVKGQISKDKLGEIYDLLCQGKKQKDIANLYGVTLSAISYVKRHVLPKIFPGDKDRLTAYGMSGSRENITDNWSHYIKEWHQKKLLNDPEYKVMRNLRRRIHTVITREYKKRNRSKDLVGCSKEDLVIHLEKQFKDGMSWDNYGRKGWHIDHIRPVCSFNLTKVEEQKVCFHYTNLQPLWAEENQKKGGRESI